MKPFNKEEYNKLCAELLGLHRSDKVAIYKMTAYPYDFLRFDFDWNWIMEVVDKINDPDNGIMVSIHPNSCMITDNGRRGKWSINAISNIVRIIDAKDRKEAVVQAIWEFLQFYNQQKS